MARTTIKIGPHTIRTASTRRYCVVAHRDEPFTAPGKVYDRNQGIYVDGEVTYVAFADICKRSDSYETVRTIAIRKGHTRGPRVSYTIVDTATGEIGPSF